jgi:hypothetical protein
MAEMGHGRKTNHVRSDGSFPPKRSPSAGDGCTADHCQPGLRLAAELDPIADTGAGDLGDCLGPKPASRAAKKIGKTSTSRPDIQPQLR